MIRLPIVILPELFKFSIWNLLKYAMGIFLPLIMYPVITRNLGVDNFGKFNLSMGIVTYLLLFTALGFQQYGSVCVAKYRYDVVRLKKFVTGTLILQFSSMFLIFIIGLIAIHFFKFNDNYLLSILFFLIPSQIISLDWLLMGLEEFKFSTIRSLVSSVLTVLSVLFFVRTSDDIYVYALILVILQLLVGSYTIYKYRLYVSFWSIKLDYLLELIKSVKNYFYISIFGSLYVNSDILVVGFFFSLKELGYYALASRLYKVTSGATSAVISVNFPSAISAIHEGDFDKSSRLLSRSFLQILFFGSLFHLFFILFASDFILIFAGKEYLPSAPIVQLFMYAMILTNLSVALSNQVIYPLGHEKKVSVSAVLGILLFFVTTSIIIRFFGFSQIVLPVLITEFFLFLFISLRTYNLKPEIFNLSNILILLGFVIISSALAILFYIFFDFDFFGKLVLFILFFVITSLFFWKQNSLIKKQIYN
jgi:O-antigen/teichoic acid export membrane protein